MKTVENLLSSKIVRSLISVLVCVFVITGVVLAGGKVTVCHKENGNGNAYKTLEISENALKAHLDHGDSEGACPAPVDPTEAPAATSTSKPVDPTATDQPVASTSTRVPSTSTSVPSTSTSVPATSTGVPSTSTSVPATSTGVPSTSTSVPSTSTGVPVTATQSSSTATSVPATATPRIGINPTITMTPVPVSTETVLLMKVEETCPVESDCLCRIASALETQTALQATQVALQSAQQASCPAPEPTKKENTSLIEFGMLDYQAVANKLVPYVADAEIIINTALGKVLMILFGIAGLALLVDFLAKLRASQYCQKK